MNNYYLSIVYYFAVFKVKGVLMDSKLPVETLGKIWDLADQDKDGMLDRNEFIAVSCLSALHSLLNSYSLYNICTYDFVSSAR